MPPSYFPLRWESTGDQWWYASPIDWAAANGLYDVVRELLHIDTNLLIKLTSLRRIRRLETVWDDQDNFSDVSKCRSLVARKLLLECETSNKGHNTLIRAGYGGWLLYTAASAGDVDFVKEMLNRDPILVFGEGEYGVTDLFYAAARSKNCEVFRLLLGSALSPRQNEGEGEEEIGENYSVLRWEMMNRAIHAAARGGNSEILKVLIGENGDALIYKDSQGSTILHSASGRGQFQIVKELVATFNIINSVDNLGNTALHVAAYRGHLAVVKVLISAEPSLASVTNNFGDTFLHLAVAGCRTPGFRRVEQQMELMKQLISGEVVNIENIINMRNNEGRTALHLAVAENIQSNVVELLMTVPSINLNVRDADKMTPLDTLKRLPRSASSKILIKQLKSAGGISNFQDNDAKNAMASHLKVNGLGGSPGTSFRIPDAEIFLCTGLENASDKSVEDDSCFSEFESPKLSDIKRSDSANYGARRLKSLLQWPRKKERKPASYESGDDDSLASFSMSKTLEDNPIPLRQRFSKALSLPGNKRTFSIRSSFPSPLTKKKFTAGLTKGVIQASPQLVFPDQSPSSPVSGASVSSTSPRVNNNQKGHRPSRFQSFDGSESLHKNRQDSFNKKLMNQYFCFGAQGLAVEESLSMNRPSHKYNYASSLVS